MAIKKKAPKTAKKGSHPKKPVGAKKLPAKSSGHAGGKPAKKAVHKAAPKPVQKKGLPARKVVVAKKAPKPALRKTPAKPALPVKHPARPEPKLAGPKFAAKKTEPKAVLLPHSVKPEIKKTLTPVKPVKIVIPEMKTKTVRKYEPEFTKSVLDIYTQEATGPTMRYSDAELSEFRELVMKKLETAKKELTYLQGLITRKDEMGGDDTDNRYMTMEDGSMSMEREQLSQMASRQITFIDHLEKAMMRIENKTYGICRVTGKLIDKARLRAVPHATLSIEAKQTMNK
jgi:RNA polymerase-binding transcription factor DksA